VTLRTAAELGALARAARRALGWTQAQAAHEAGVSRQFVIALESGRHPNAELWRVLAVLSAVGVTLSGSVTDPPQEQAADFDLDRHLEAFAEPSPSKAEQVRSEPTSDARG
jgi:transcriptional regulator with XRE-family HTH domain